MQEGNMPNGEDESIHSEDVEKETSGQFGLKGGDDPSDPVAERETKAEANERQRKADKVAEELGNFA